MAKKDLKIAPHDIDNNAWWYEENGGIEIHVDTVVNVHHEHVTIKISWREIRAALKRKDK